MASDDAAEGSRSRRRMDPNMYFSLPPLLRPPAAGLTDDALDRPVSLPNSAGPAAPVAPRTDEQAEEFLAPIMAVYSPWNALSSTAEEQSMLVDSYDYDTTWLDGHNAGDGEEAVASVGGANSSSSTTRSLAPGLESYEDPTPWVERFVRPAAAGRVTGAGGVEMVSTTSLLTRSSVQGAVVVDMEARTPELRFQRLIQISRQHGIVRTGATTNRSSSSSSQRATSPEAEERLSWAIQRSHNSLETARRKKKLDGGNKAAGGTKGAGGASKDDECGCNSSFECNICLDPAKQPVVTPCGHLFCWPCLYRWLHAHSVHSECPVCKGEVLEVNVTPIYGRGDDDDDDHRRVDASGSGGGGSSLDDMPPRPHANRTQSLRQQMPAADARGIETLVRRLIAHHGVGVRGQPMNPVEAPPTTLVVPASRPRARVRRPQRQEEDSVSAAMLNAGNVVVPAENSGQVPLPLPPPAAADADNTTTPTVPAAPAQSSSVEQTSASSTAAVIVGEPGSSRRSRPSGSPTTRRTRRRQP